MGYRLHATIPNVKPFDHDLELGKQYDGKWDDFNNYWFAGSDHGRVSSSDIIDFYIELTYINDQPGEYKLYNLDLLEKMVSYAIKHKMDIHFISY